MNTKFKNIFLFVLAVLVFSVPTGSYASAFAFHETSASGLGNAYAGAAVADDAGVAWGNPAGMSRLEHPMVSLSVHAVTPDTKFYNRSSKAACVNPPICRPLGGQGGAIGYTEYAPATFVVFPLSKELTLGVAVTVPFGLTHEYEQTWLGRYQATKAGITAVNVNPSIAFKATEFLSLGIGLNYQKLDAELTSAVNPTVALALAAQAGAIPSELTSSVLAHSLEVPDMKATITGRDSAYGYNLGVLLTLTPDTRVEVSYRSPIEFAVRGDIAFSPPSVAVTSPSTAVVSQVLAALQQPGGSLSSGAVRGTFKTPDSLNLSVSSAVTPQLQILGDVMWTKWSNVPKLEFTSADGAVLTSTEYNWKDTWRYSIGANYKVDSKLTLRGGLFYDQTPMDTAHRTPYAPDGDRVGFSVGGSYLFTPNLALDVGYAYVTLKDPQMDNRNEGATAVYGAIDGFYTSRMATLGVGVTYTFK